jgi:hypothetical protein
MRIHWDRVLALSACAAFWTVAIIAAAKFNGL